MGSGRHQRWFEPLLSLLSVMALVADCHAQLPFSYNVSSFDNITLKDWNVMTVWQSYAFETPKPQILNPNADNVLSLTIADGDFVQAGLAVLNKEVPWGKGFEAKFTFRLFNAGVNRPRMNATQYDGTNPDVGGDGITFAIFSDLPKQAGKYGGGLGYFEGDLEATQRSVAIEFDTWNNPEYFDPINEGGIVGGDTNHIGMNLAGMVVSEKTAHIKTPFNDGGQKNVWVVYYAFDKVLQVYYNDTGYDRPNAPVFTFERDLEQALGVGTQSVFVGFTGGSASAYENQTITSFTISTLNGTEKPSTLLPQPEPIADPIILLLKEATNYTDFNTPDWVPFGSASVLTSGPLQLTTIKDVELNEFFQPLAEPGQATLQQPVDCNVGCTLYAAFAITNDVRLVDQSDLVPGGDGFAILVTQAPTLPPADNSPGGLGYFGVPDSVAVEVDTWFDLDTDPESPRYPDGTLQLTGPDGNHIGVSLGGDPKSVATVHLPAPANDNQFSTPSYNLRIKHIWADIDNMNKKIKVFYNDASSSKPVSPILSTSLDINTAVGSTMLYPSLTAATSRGLSNHYILAASFSSAQAILTLTGENTFPIQETSFPTFDSSKGRAFLTAGSASNIASDSGTLALTNDSASGPVAGMLAFIAPLNISEGVQIKMAVQMTSSEEGEVDPIDGSTARDGMALVLLGYRTTVAGQPSSGIGYGGLLKSVAIEMDTFYNPEFDPTDDGNHIGINVNGNMTSATSAHIPDDMADGEKKYLWLDYDVEAKVARVYFNYRDSKPLSPVLSQSMDLLDILGTPAPHLLVTSGASGTTGGATIHELCSLTITNFKPAPPTATDIKQFDAIAMDSVVTGGVAGSQKPANGRLALTSVWNATGPQAGLVRVENPVDISKGASVYMQVVMNGMNGTIDPADKWSGRDGMALVFLGTNNTTPGAGGNGLGYGGRNDSVAVELDIWYDANYERPGDGNHIGINTKGNLASLTAIKLDNNMGDGRPKNVWVDYNNAARTIEVYFNPANETKPGSPILSYMADIPFILDTNDVYIGVTAGTDSTNGSATVMELCAFSVKPGLPETTQVRWFANFSNPNAVKSWVGGYGTTLSGGLRLTDLENPEAQSGGVVLQDPIVISEGFSAYMQVVLTPGGSYDFADNSTGPNGIALVLLPKNESAVDIAAAIGEGLGYSGIANSVAVELDSVYSEAWDPFKTDGSEDGNHVGINVNGNLESVASATVPINLADGATKHVWVDYDNMEKVIKVYVNSIDPVKPLDPLLSASVDVEVTLGTNSPFFAVTSGSANPKGPAILNKFSVQPGNPDSTMLSFGGPNNLYKISPTQLNNITRSGTAATLLPNPDGSLPLTDPNITTPQSTLVFLPRAVNFTQGLSTHFQIRMMSPATAETDPADGFLGTGGACIVFLPNNQATAGDYDSGMGYGSIPGNSLAVEIDKYFDSTDPINPVTGGTLQVQGADGNHIGINQDGSVQSTYTAHITRDFNAHVPNNIWIDYDPTGQLYVYFNGPNVTKPSKPVLTAPIDMLAKLGSPSAYIGVSAGTTNASTQIDLVRSRVVTAMPKLPVLGAAAQDPVFIGNLNRTSVGAIKVKGSVASVPQPDATGGLKLVDMSTLTPQGSLLTLNPHVDISRGFQGRFQFVFTPNNATDDVDPADNWTGRDGAAIVLLGPNYQAVGSPGGGLGYGGLNKSIAIELDSWYDSWDPVSDAGLPDGNHVGINANGDLTSIAAAALPQNLNNGVPKNVWVDIDSVSKTIYVSVSESDFKPDAPTLAIPLDVISILGTDKPALAVSAGARGKSSVQAQVMRTAEFSSQQPQAALAAAVKPLQPPLPPNAVITSRSWSMFNAGTIQMFQLGGSAAPTIPDGYLQLTDPSVNTAQAGIAVVREPLDASTGFSVYLKAEINITASAATDPDDGGRGRDGIALVLLGNNDTITGQPAGGLGYGGLTRSVAVELDSWKNDEYRDPDGNHVGINIGGNLTSVTASRIGSDLCDGTDKHLWVDYDNLAGLINVYVKGDGMKPEVPILTTTINLPATLGSNQLYVAVSSGTIDGAAAHIVKTLSYKAGVQPLNPKTRSYTSFSPEVVQNALQLRGVAVVDPFQPGTIALTTDTPNNQAGMVTVKDAVNITQGVSLFVQFQMNATARAVADPSGAGAMGGDGMVVMLVGAGNAEVGEGGAGMGYKDMTAKSIGMELDTFFNSGTDPVNPQNPWGKPQFSGSDGNHLGLNLNGNMKSLLTQHIGNDFNDGQIHSVWMDCDNIGKMIYMYYNPLNATKPLLPDLSVTLDQSMSEILGTVQPLMAVSAGTSNGATVHRIKSISLTEGPVMNPLSFPSPNNNGWSAWTLSGSAASQQPDPSGKLKLTSTSGGNQVGRAILPRPINMTRGLSIHFVADMKTAASGKAAKDGVALVLVPSLDLPAPSGYMGYQNLKKSVAIELDSFFDDAFDPKDTPQYTSNSSNGAATFKGPDGNHVGLNVNGASRSATAVHITQPLADGQPKFVWVDYDNVARVVMVYISNSGIKPNGAVFAHRIDIQKTLGTAWPYVMLTASSPDGSTAISARSLSVEPSRPMKAIKAAHTSSSKGLSSGAIAGLVIGVLVAILLLSLLVWWLCCQCRCCKAYYNFFYRKPRPVEPMYVV